MFIKYLAQDKIESVLKRTHASKRTVRSAQHGKCHSVVIIY